MKLTEQRSKHILKGAVPLTEDTVGELMKELPRWTAGNGEITREFRFKDFREAIAFVNRVASIANEEDHHPDIFISYNKVRVTLSTHKIGGLSMNDFITAAKIDEAEKLDQHGEAA
jgi:4a-hydroxytetrahydrobiopterin dehydratase